MIKLIKKFQANPILISTISTTIWSTAGKSVGFLVPFFVAAWFGITSETDVFFFVYGFVIFITGILAISTENIIVPFISNIAASDRSRVGVFVGGALVSATIAVILISIASLWIAIPLFKLVTKFSHDQLNLLFILFIETLPLLLLVTLSSILSGALNAYKRFWVPALSPAARSVVTILFIYLFKSRLGIHSIPFAYVAGEIARLVILASYILSKRIFRIIISLNIDFHTAQFLKSASYQAIAVAAVGLNTVVDRSVASWLGIGGITILEYAYRLYLVPIFFLSGGFAVTFLSHWSSKYYEDKNYRNIFWIDLLKRVSMMTPIFLVIFAALMAVSGLSVRLIYGHGQLSEANIIYVTNIFRVYLWGFVPYMACQIFVLGYLVLKKTRELILVAIVVNFLNLTLDLILVKFFKLAGIALSTVIVNFIMLLFAAYLLRRIITAPKINHDYA